MRGVCILLLLLVASTQIYCDGNHFDGPPHNHTDDGRNSKVLNKAETKRTLPAPSASGPSNDSGFDFNYFFLWHSDATILNYLARNMAQNGGNNARAHAAPPSPNTNDKEYNILIDLSESMKSKTTSTSFEYSRVVKSNEIHLNYIFPANSKATFLKFAPFGHKSADTFIPYNPDNANNRVLMSYVSQQNNTTYYLNDRVSNNNRNKTENLKLKINFVFASNSSATLVKYLRNKDLLLNGNVLKIPQQSKLNIVFTGFEIENDNLQFLWPADPRVTEIDVNFYFLPDSGPTLVNYRTSKR